VIGRIVGLLNIAVLVYAILISDRLRVNTAGSCPGHCRSVRAWVLDRGLRDLMNDEQIVGIIHDTGACHVDHVIT
jgi:hypothetical protein